MNSYDRQHQNPGILGAGALLFMLFIAAFVAAAEREEPANARRLPPPPPPPPLPPIRNNSRPVDMDDSTRRRWSSPRGANVYGEIE